MYKRRSPCFTNRFFIIRRICVRVAVSSTNTKYFFVEKKSSAVRKLMAHNEQCTATRLSHFHQQYFIRRNNNFVSCLRIVYSELNTLHSSSFPSLVSPQKQLLWLSQHSLKPIHTSDRITVILSLKECQRHSRSCKQTAASCGNWLRSRSDQWFTLKMFKTWQPIASCSDFDH